MWYRETISTELFTMDPQPIRRFTCTTMTITTIWLPAWLRSWVASTSVQTVRKVITPKKNTLATTYAIIVEIFTIKLKMIGYIVKIVDDTSKDQHALISTTRRRHWETQHVPPITNVRTADKPWTHEWEIIPVETSIARLVKIIIHLNTSVACYLWITTIDSRNRLTSFSILNVSKMTWSSVNKDTNRMTTENVFIANHRGVELSNISLIYV
jgi:hypothetical protein